jgi:hypothetical protein
MNTSRPVTVTSAIVLLTLLSLVDLTIVLIPPQHLSLLSGFIYAWSIVFGVVGLSGVFGLWKLKRWGLRLSTVLAALALLTWAPGLVLTLVLGDTTAHVVWSLALTVCYALVLVLVALPATRKAYAATQA